MVFQPRMLRRAFMQWVSVAASLGLGGCASPSLASWRFFREEEARLVDALTERLIPADEDAGASEAGVVHYIDRQLTGFFANHQDDYREGLRGIEALCHARFGDSFAALQAGQQDAILREAEGDDELDGFFRLLLDHTVQGFYGDPRHGGNRDFVSWRMVGLPHPPVRGRRPAVRS